MDYNLFVPEFENQTAILTDKDSISFKSLEETANKLADWILDLNLGDRPLGILSPNSPHMIEILLACLKTNTPILFCSLRLSPSDWSAQLHTAEVEHLIGTEELYSQLDHASLKFYNIEALPLNSTGSDRSTPTSLSDKLAILFTSSVSGHKKGVILSGKNFLSSAEASNRITKLSPGDTWLLSLPLFHVGGLGIIFRTLLAGAATLIQEDTSIPAVAALARKKAITHISLVPTQLQELIDIAKDEDPDNLSLFSGIKAIVLAGAPSSERLLADISKYSLPVLSAWGMTETTAHCTCMSLDDPKSLVTGVGKPFYHTRLKLVDDEGEEVSEGEVGEILVKGPTVCAGYFYEDDLLNVDTDGWLSTGDLGVLDQEGNLKIAGRKDDMFISGGENIHAGEIENVARRYSPDIEVAVIPVDHDKWGKRPILYFESKQAEQDSRRLTEFLKEKLPKIKVPDEVILLTKLPRTAIGKVDYKGLKKLWSES